METYRSLWKLVLTALGVAAAAASPSPLKCNVTRRPDGSVTYQLSQRPTSSRCETCWEDRNKTVLARDGSSDLQRVQNLTDESLVLKVCQDYLLYTKNCDGVFDEVHCKVNCSLLEDEHSLRTTVNSTLIHFFWNWCLELSVILAPFVGLVVWFCKRKGRTRTGQEELGTNAQPEEEMKLTELSES